MLFYEYAGFFTFTDFKHQYVISSQIAYHNNMFCLLNRLCSIEIYDLFSVFYSACQISDLDMLYEPRFYFIVFYVKCLWAYSFLTLLSYGLHVRKSAYKTSLYIYIYIYE